MGELKKQGLESLFCPYEQALALKELGFDEPCFKVYDNLGFLQEESVMNTCEIECGCVLERYLAPTFSQSFRWFREKYGLEGVAQRSEDFIFYKWKISQYNEDGKKYVADWYEYETYEEAELGCLRKLIEIVKEKR